MPYAIVYTNSRKRPIMTISDFMNEDAAAICADSLMPKDAHGWTIVPMVTLTEARMANN